MAKKTRKNNLNGHDIDMDYFEATDPKFRQKRRNRRKNKNKFDNAVRNLRTEDDYDEFEDVEYEDDL